MKQYVMAEEYTRIGGKTLMSPSWGTGISYVVGDRCAWLGLEYECLQAHGSLAGQSPNISLSIWEKVTTNIDVNLWLQLAAVKIDMLTFGRIATLDNITEFQKELVQRAVVLQADHGYTNYQDTGDIDSPDVTN